MTKEIIIESWYKLFNSKKVEKKFVQLVFGSHTGVRDGWRYLTLAKEDACITITLDKNPSGYSIYDANGNGISFDLTKEEGLKMCVEFDERGTLQKLPVERLDELL